MTTPAFGLTPFPLPLPPRSLPSRLTRPRSHPHPTPLATASPPRPVENLVVIGSGPAGYTAAIYAGRANLKPVLLEGMTTGVPGGQLMTTTDVENFPGFPDGIQGPILMSQMRRQAQRWGAEMLSDDAVSVDLDTAPFRITTGMSGEVRAHAVIVATGASAKRLHVPGEETFWSRGISACAICDGAAPIFAGQALAVVGGGDSACEEAVYLCKYATHVHLLVRGRELRASKTLQDRVRNHLSVTVHFGTTVVEAVGKEAEGGNGVVGNGVGGNGVGGNGVGGNGVGGVGSPLRGVRVRRQGGGEEVIEVRGMFYAIGHTPNTGFLRGTSRLRFDEKGYMVTKEGGPVTPLDGVFAAGDVADKEWRQAVTAAGSGCMAALAAERYLTAKGLVREYHHEEDLGLAPARAEVEQRESEAERRAEGRVDDEESYDIEETWHSGQFALRKLYHESKRPLIVKYVSPGCGPCRQLKPMLHAVVRSLEGKVHYVEIDISKDPEIAEAAGVTGSPTVQIFYEKALEKEFRGVKMKSEYRRVVEDLLNRVPVG